MSCQFFIKAYYAVIIRFAFRKCWTWNKNGFLSWLLNDFQIFLIIELNMNLKFLNMYFNESRMALFFLKRKPKTDKVCCQGWHYLFMKKMFFQVQWKKNIKLFSSLLTSVQAYMLFLTTPKNVRNLDSICPHI